MPGLPLSDVALHLAALAASAVAGYPIAASLVRRQLLVYPLRRRNLAYMRAPMTRNG